MHFKMSSSLETKIDWYCKAIQLLLLLYIINMLLLLYLCENLAYLFACCMPY
jgi:hypothetical protein